MTTDSRRLVAVCAAALLVVALLLSVLATSWQQRPHRGQGPLNVGFWSGQSAASPPVRAPWWSWYAGGFLCLESGTKPVILRAVRPVAALGFRALDVVPWVRVNPSSEAAGPPGPLVASTTGYGSPPDFSEEYAGPSIGEGGPFVPVAGTVVDRSCAVPKGPEGEDAAGEDAAGPFPELVLSVRSPEQGAVVERLEIDYRVGRRHYTQVVARRFVLCGERVAAEVEHAMWAGMPVCDDWDDDLPPS